MGQAKRRGTYEQRKESAIILAGIEREERKRLESKRLVEMTEEERKRKRDRERVLTRMMAACLSVGVVPYILNR